MTASSDAVYMQQALALALQGEGTTPPNPMVGCVIVKDGVVVGRGFHQQAGGPHAEVFALREAGELARGATAYVTLEPCSHFGRTPPCADALIAAGLKRVVVAMQDPNPQVAGQGLARLQQAGIDVEVGVEQAKAEALNREFLFRMQHQKPLVRLKLAASVDGGVALANGQSQWLTGDAARQDVQRWRARSCAILSTAQTVKADRASLTVRDELLPKLADGTLRQPIRIILDRRCRLTGDEPLFAQGGPVWLIHAGDPATWPALSEQVRVEVNRIRISLDDVGKLCLPSLFVWLSHQKLNSIWVEAGSQLATALWQAQLVDELWLYQAPMLLGQQALPMMQLGPWTSLGDTPRWCWHEVTLIGQDVRLIARITE